MPTVSLTCTHTTVLLQEAVDALVHDPQGSYLDATFGRGGHSRAILARMGPNARLCAFDQDPQAVQSAQDLLQDPRFSVRHVPFSSLRDWPAASLSGVLLDIGVSSPQIDQAERGFSFRHDGPLDMRMDPTRGRSVHQWLVTASQEEIAGVIRDHGEERFAVQIA
jgi:16S rRNA (cytosine1402-N4)-methyltransferase